MSSNEQPLNSDEQAQPPRKTEVIALVSGKGGVGKTALAGSMASLISQLGRKVLLIDADIATHGMTYFFVDQVQEARKPALDKPSELSLPERVVSLNENLDFIPSKSEFQRGERALEAADEFKEDQETASKNLLNMIQAASGAYDLVIVDCQAGIVESTYHAVRVAKQVVSIMEADPVCVWASRALDRAFGDILPDSTFYLVNKLFPEEVAQYRALTDYMRIFQHLPPLPFDFEVRRAFARKVLPTESLQPSAFTFGLIRTLTDLLPSLEASLAAFEHTLQDQAVGPVKRKIQELDSEIQELATPLEFRRRFSVLAIFVFSFLVAFSMALGLGALMDLVPDIFKRLFPVFPMVSLACALLVYLFDRLVVPATKPGERESMQLELERLREERKSLVTYLATMSKELMISETKLPPPQNDEEANREAE